MSTFHVNVAGFRVSHGLKKGLEDLLAPDALRLAEENLRAWRGYAADGTMTPEESEPWVLEAEERLASGGVMRWTDFMVTNGGITRGAEFAVDGMTVTGPTLDGASSFNIALTVGATATVQLVVRLSVAFGDICGVSVDAPEDRIMDLRDRIVPFVESFVDPGLLPARPTFKVFIGHGGDPQWKYLYRALNDTHGIAAEAFESSERAGYHTLTVVDQMVRSSAVAVVIMTGELQDADGTLRARENVVHEVGFCQGALGISQTIVVLEEGVSEPSNISGLTQVRFPKGQLIEVEGRIVEILRQRQDIHAYQQA